MTKFQLNLNTNTQHVNIYAKMCSQEISMEFEPTYLNGSVRRVSFTTDKQNISIIYYFTLLR